MSYVCGCWTHEPQVCMNRHHSTHTKLLRSSSRAKYTRCGKIQCPRFTRWKEGPKQIFIVKKLYVEDASLQHCEPSN